MRLWHISEIEPTDQNIFFYWDGQPIKQDYNRWVQARDAIATTLHHNLDRPVWLISNCEEPADWPNVRVCRWDDELYSPMPQAAQWAKLYNAAGPRDRCDVIRFLLLYKYGGSYVDTDDICLQPITPYIKNIVSQSYDPHTCHYDGWQPEDCLPGWMRGHDQGWNHIPWFPRTDCWYNWQPEHELILNIIKRGSQKPELGINTIYSYGDTGRLSWQSLILLECKAQLNNYNKTWTSALTLIYLPESHVATCSQWDRGAHGGAIHTIWPQSEEPWGQQLFTATQADHFFKQAQHIWPNAAHMWLHDKGDGISPQWDPRAPKQKQELMSTHIIRALRQLANIQ